MADPVRDSEEIDWVRLRAAAREVMTRAYAPYSHFPVGAAGLAKVLSANDSLGDVRLVTGCNVENASYGVGLCAECGLVSALHASGGGRLIAVSIVGGDGEPLVPCGRCRQLLYEHGGPELLIETPRGILPVRQILPDAFGPEDLKEY
ncbi:MAG: cytidine deaminase [Kineosporiaceae bacterium]